MLTNDALHRIHTTGHATVVLSVNSTADARLEEEEDARPWEHSDPFFSAAARELIQRVLKCYVRQFVMVWGIPGNFLTCVVFFKQGLSERIPLLLFWLGVADFLHLLSQWLLMPGCYLQDRVHVQNWDILVNSKIAHTTLWSNFVCASLLVIVSLDRCVSVALPFHSPRLLSYRLTATAILLCYLVPLLMCLPAFLVFTIKWRTDPSTNRSMAYSHVNHWVPIDSKLAIDLIHYFPTLAKPVFIVTIIICSVITVKNLRQADRNRKEMTSKVKDTEEDGSRRLTRMLLFVCGAYIVLALPEACSAIAVLAVAQYVVFRKYHNTFLVVQQFIWIASCLNSTLNFFAYLVLSTRFRRTLQELCLCFGLRKTNRRLIHETNRTLGNVL